MRDQRYVALHTRNTRHAHALKLGKLSVSHLNTVAEKAEVPKDNDQAVAVKVEIKHHAQQTHHTTAHIPEAESLEVHHVAVHKSEPAPAISDKTDNDEVVAKVIETVNIHGRTKHSVDKEPAPLKFRSLRLALTVIFGVTLVGLGVLSARKAYYNESRAMANPASSEKTFNPLSAKDVSENIKKLVNDMNDSSDFDVSNITPETTGVQE